MNGGKVLVIEDDALVAELLCQLLELAGFATHAAANGTDGIAQSRSWRPNAIVLDLMLPDLDGNHVCQAIKQDPATAGIDVLMLTAAIGAGHRRSAFASGVDRFMNKPFQPDDIVRELRALGSRDATARANGVLHASVHVVADLASWRAWAPAFEETLFSTTPLAPDELEAVCTRVRDLCTAFFSAPASATADGLNMALHIARAELTISLGPRAPKRAGATDLSWHDAIASFLRADWLSGLAKDDTIDITGDGTRLIYRRRLLPDDSGNADASA